MITRTGMHTVMSRVNSAAKSGINQMSSENAAIDSTIWNNSLPYSPPSGMHKSLEKSDDHSRMGSGKSEARKVPFREHTASHATDLLGLARLMLTILFLGRDSG